MANKTNKVNASTIISSDGDVTVTTEVNNGMFAGTNITGKITGTFIAHNDGPIDTSKGDKKNR